MRLTYRDISGWSFGADRINLKTGGLMEKDQINIKGFTERGEEICHVISSYVQLLSGPSV
jgi:hypothetical protein